MKKELFILPNQFNELEIIRKLLLKKNHDKFSVVYIPTFNCNLRCDYCYQQNINYINNKKISYHEVVKWVSDNLPVNVKEVNIQFYGGEPLLEKKLIFDFLKELSIKIGKEKITICLCTNGYFLTKEFLLELDKRCHIDEIQLTVHDFDKDLKKYHEVILKNINEIVLEDRWKLNLKFDINRDNCEKIKGFLFKLNRKTGYSITIAPILKCGNKLDESIYDKENIATILDIQKKLRDLGYRVNKRISYICHLLINPDAFVIDPQGYIYKCDSMAGIKEFSIGSIPEYKVNSESINLKETFLSDLCNQPEECFQCEVMPMCMGNCRFRNKFKVREADICYKEIIRNQLLEEIGNKNNIITISEKKVK